MAPPACESGSQEVEESDARGSKKRSRGSNFAPVGVNFRPRGVPNGLLEPPCGRQVGLWVGKELYGSWDRLGALLARLGPVVGRFSHPGGGAGEAPGGHF